MYNIMDSKQIFSIIIGSTFSALKRYSFGMLDHILDLTGAVSCAHCNCMAGLGEVCTHIAAALFYLEAAYRINRFA